MSTPFQRLHGEDWRANARAEYEAQALATLDATISKKLQKHYQVKTPQNTLESWYRYHPTFFVRLVGKKIYKLADLTLPQLWTFGTEKRARKQSALVRLLEAFEEFYEDIPGSLSPICGVVFRWIGVGYMILHNHQGLIYHACSDAREGAVRVIREHREQRLCLEFFDDFLSRLDWKPRVAS